jgi:hypothetical protein
VRRNNFTGSERAVTLTAATAVVANNAGGMRGRPSYCSVYGSQPRQASSTEQDVSWSPVNEEIQKP